MLTILNDPAGITGRRRLPLDYGITLQANIERHLSGGADAELRINGAVVDPLTDPRLDMPPSRLDVVIVVLRPAGYEVLFYIAVVALAVVAYAMARPPPNTESGKDSPNNKLTSQSNVARAYQAIPDVYGYRRVWPDLIQPSTVEYIDQIKYVTEWMCISRGFGTVTAVQYAETPIADIAGSSYEVFEPVPVEGYPESGSTTLSDVYETFASEEVNGQEMPYAIGVLEKGGVFAAISGATTFTIKVQDGDDLDYMKGLSPAGTIRVTFSYSLGTLIFDEVCTVLGFVVADGDTTFTLSSSAWASTEGGLVTPATFTPVGVTTITSGPFTLPLSGDEIWWSTVFLRGLKGSVVIRASWWQIDNFGAEIVGTRETEDATYSADTFDQRFYTTKVQPAAGYGRYRAEFTRISTQQDDSGADVAKLEELYAVRHFATKLLPGVTVFRVTTKATLAATGFSDRKFNLRWSRKVRTLTSDSLSESRNFARILAHIWSISGNEMSGLDTAALATINGQHGEDSPLLRADVSFDDADMSLGERMQYVANMARCTMWRDGVKWTSTRDQARAGPEMQLDYRNLAAGGDSTIAYAAHLPASNDGVEIEYIDELTQAKKSYVRLSISTGTPIAGVSKNPKKIKLPGCATLVQAENRAQVEARRLIYQRTNVSDTALADATSLGLGAVVRWIDPNDFGGDDLQAGEVIGISGALITTSEAIDWKGETSGRILFTGIDGRNIGAPVLCYPAPDGSVELDMLPDGLYVADDSRQCGSRYAFAVGLTQSEIESAGLFSATEIRPGADGTVALSLASYDTRIYEGDA